MVIGNGLIAKRFSPYMENERFLVFASGVSHSKTTDTNQYKREAALLQQCLAEQAGKTFIYFSTCGVYDSEEQQSPYVLHKQAMENCIKEKAKQYYIFRISNLAGHTANPNTVLNFFYQHIIKHTHFFLWVNTWRNIIDIDDAYTIISHIIENDIFKNTIINIANTENYPVKTIATAMEQILHVKGNYTSIEKGHFFRIDTSAINPIIDKLKINFDEHYLSNLIIKYFGQSA